MVGNLITFHLVVISYKNSNSEGNFFRFSAKIDLNRIQGVYFKTLWVEFLDFGTSNGILLNSRHGVAYVLQSNHYVVLT